MPPSSADGCDGRASDQSSILMGTPPPPHTHGFDVTLEGTSEEVWHAMLQRFPLAQAPAGSLIVIAPHPDDETLGAGGLIQLCAERLQSVRVISVTAGEAACPGVPNLARIRALELRHALACLSSTPIEIQQLGMPDGAVAAEESQLRRVIDALVSADDIVVAPFERDGHPDHDAVGRASLSVARRRGLTLLRYPIWAWHHSSPQAFAGARFTRIALTRRAESPSGRLWTAMCRSYAPKTASPQ